MTVALDAMMDFDLTPEQRLGDARVVIDEEEAVGHVGLLGGTFHALESQRDARPIAASHGVQWTRARGFPSLRRLRSRIPRGFSAPSSPRWFP